MSKFGDLITDKVPVLIDFFTDWNEPSVTMSSVVTHVAAALGDKGKVLKINIEKNPELAEALRIKTDPTLIIYKNGQMVWRQSGEVDANTLISTMLEYTV